MVARSGPLALLGRELRQARKGAAVTVDASAGVWLVRAAAFHALTTSPHLDLTGHGDL